MIDSGGVEINPKTINAVSTLRVYAFLANTIPNGGKIQLIFPKEITRQPTSTACKMVIAYNF